MSDQPLPTEARRHAEVRDERRQHHQRQEADRRGLRRPRQAPAGDPRIGQRRVVLDGHVAAGGDEKEHGQAHHQRRDDDPHAEQPAIDELHDVEIGLRGQQVVDAEHQRRGEIRERPDEDQQGAGHVPRRRQRQRDRAQLGPAAGPHALGRLLQRGIDLGQRVEHVEGDHREQVERLHQPHAVQAVDEVDRPGHAEPVVEQHVHRAGSPHDEGEAEHAHQRRRDDGDQRQVAEQVTAAEVEAHQQQGDGEAQHGRAGHGGQAEQYRVPQRAQVVRVPAELEEVRQREAARLVGERVVEDPQQGVDEEQDQEQPDGRIAQRRPRPPPGVHSSGSVRTAEAGKPSCSGSPTGSSRWCHASRTSTLMTSPDSVSTS